MSSSMTLVGRIATQPEIRYSDKTGKAWGKFRIADNYTENARTRQRHSRVVLWLPNNERMERQVGTNAADLRA